MFVIYYLRFIILFTMYFFLTENFVKTLILLQTSTECFVKTSLVQQLKNNEIEF